MDLISQIADSLSPLFTQGKKKLIYTCPPELRPYELVQYLESFGVKCTPKNQVEISPDGNRTATIYVSKRQVLWAAKLAAGYGVTVLEPRVWGMVKPNYRWGNGAYHSGLTATILRGLSSLFGVNAKLAPKKPRLGRRYR